MEIRFNRRGVGHFLWKPQKKGDEMRGIINKKIRQRWLRLMAVVLAGGAASSYATDYLVSTQADFDAVKNAVLQPGDAILLERGQQFVGMLAPTGTGTEAAPIRIDAYGEGDRPLIDAQGLNEAGVLLEGDIAFWEVSGLEIINNDGTDNDENYFFGVLVVVSGADETVYEHIYIDDIYIHDVNGGVEGKDRGGIHVYMEGLDSSIIDDLRITNNRIEDVGGVGIATKSSCGNVTVDDDGYTAEYLWTGVYIGGNYLYRTGRNSIIIRISQDPIVERNVAAYPGRHSQGNSIFCFDTVGCIMQYNETYGNTVEGSTDSSSADRGGFDADYTCVDTTIQYNYSHDNEYFCAIMKKIQRNVIIRYNITQNEKRGFYFYGFNNNSEVENVHIYGNTHYVSAGNSAAVFVEGRSPHDTLLENNIFYFEDADDSSYGTGDDSGATFNNNIYYHLTPHASDPSPITGDPLFTFPGIAGQDIDLTTMGGLRGYQLQPGSAAIDAATFIANSPERDIVGNRIDAGGPDLGAFEYSGSISSVTFDFLDGSEWDGGAGGGQIGANVTRTNALTGETVMLTAVDVIGQDGSRASEGVGHTLNIVSSVDYLGVNDAANPGGYSSDSRFINPGEGWVFSFDVDVYLERMHVASQTSDAELTLSSDLFDDIILADGQPSDIHDLEYRFVPAGTELTLKMTTLPTGVDVKMGLRSIAVCVADDLDLFEESQDIGAPALAGSAEFDDGIFIVEASGTDIWNNADQFHFVSSEHSNDGEVIARVDTVENTNPWAKAGVMFRETSSADSKQVMVISRPDKLVYMQYRDTTAGMSVTTSAFGDTDHAKWVKLVRDGDLFTGYYSTDGDAWTLCAQVVVSMADTVQAGLAVTSHDDTALCTAEFSSVSVSSNPLGYFADTSDIGDVGAAGGLTHVENSYVIEGSGADIWNTADEFFFASQTRSGDSTIQGCVVDVELADEWSKAGVMYRESLDDDAAQVSIVVRPDRQVAMQWRTSTGGLSTFSGKLGDTSSLKWVKLVRSGNDFTGSYSTDGTSWIPITSVTVNMADAVEVGLAVSSHNDGTLCTASITDVSID